MPTTNNLAGGGVMDKGIFSGFGVAFAFIAIGIYNFGIKPSLRKAKLANMRRQESELFDTHAKALRNAQEYVAATDYENARQQLVSATYFPLTPVDLSGLNSANIDIIRSELTQRIGDLPNYAAHNTMVVDALEGVYRLTGEQCSLVEARESLTICQNQLNQFYEAQARMVRLGEMLFYPASSAKKLGLKENELKAEVEVGLKTTLRLTTECENAAKAAWEAFRNQCQNPIATASQALEPSGAGE
jgi:hypothetical protein